MSQSKSETNIPIIRKPFSAELPPRVPYIDEDSVGADDQFVYVDNRKIVPTRKNLGGLRDGKKYFLYMQDGKMKDDMPASSVSITPQGDGTTTIATFTIDGVTGYIKAGGGGGGGTNINTLDVPLLTPMFFDYDYRQSGDEICWIPAIHYNAATASAAGSLGYKSMYFGRHQCSATADATPSTSKTYYIMDTSINDYRECVASDFNNDGSFKSGTTYYEFVYRGYRLIYDHLVADYEAAGYVDESKTYTLSTGSSVTISYRRTKDGHKIIKCTTDAQVAEIADKLDALYGDVETGTAWYYVIDTTRKMFRLPRTRYGLHGDKTYVKTAQEGNTSLNLYFHTGNRGVESNSQLDDLFDMMYPVGSIYTTLESELPSWFRANGRVWERIGEGRCLWGAKLDNSDLGSNLGAIIPRHGHTTKFSDRDGGGQSKPYNSVDPGDNNHANNSYDVGSMTGLPSGVTIGDTLRPPAIGVIFWKRTN